GGLIWTLTKKITRNSHDAEDLVQEIFIELWKNAAHFRPERACPTLRESDSPARFDSNSNGLIGTIVLNSPIPRFLSAPID
ncbi:MAG: sigma factor, partial [Planctomycetota bacterium]